MNGFAMWIMSKLKERLAPLLGRTIIFLVFVAIVYLGVAVYKKLSKTAPLMVSSSAYFVDGSGHPVCASGSSVYTESHLKIQGTVYQDEVPVKAGIVLITVATAKDLFRQSVSVPLKAGKFES